MGSRPASRSPRVAGWHALAMLGVLALASATSGCTTEGSSRAGNNASAALQSSPATTSPSPTATPTNPSPARRDVPVRTIDLHSLPFVKTVETGRLGRPPARAPAGSRPDGVTATSTRARLVAGRPSEQRKSCVVVYSAGGDAPLWTRCFTRGAKPVPFSLVAFSPDGKQLAGYVTRDEYVTTDGHPRSTLLAFAAHSGELLHHFDRDLGLATGGVRFEDNQHVLFSNSTFSSTAQEEAGFTRWLVRCSLAGVCELATPPTETSWYDTAHWPR